MKFKTLIGGSIVASSIAISSLAGAAVTFDAELGEGFIGRGDVIDHPDLGKAALVQNPTITYGEGGRYWQDCQETNPQGTTYKSFSSGNRKVGFTTTETFTARKAKGNDNISGYVLMDLEEKSTGAPVPTTLCDSAWSPKVLGQDGGGNDILSTPIFVPNEDGTLSLTFDAGNDLNGSWIWDGEANDNAGGWVPA